MIVQVEGSSRCWELESGQKVTFGRVEADIVVDFPVVSRLAGTIQAAGSFWTLSNHSARATYVVENPEGGGEYVKVAPGRAGAPIPFEFGWIRLPGLDGAPRLLVYAPEHTFEASPLPATGRATVLAYAIDPTSTYFRVLVALCEHRLKDPASVVIPTHAQIAERTGLSVPSVGFHIDYLATKKLRVKQSAAPESAGKADWQRASLISVAMRFDLVAAEDLPLLAHQGR
ncbi:hypothetical protein [Nonomuraea endophytica]|uniref:hypothetical protein n=1 Tax=Nonomuraea endophytica TaxID=714136 RepID=UPI0037CA0EAC